MNYLEIDSNGLAIGGVYSSSEDTVPSSWVVISGGAAIGWSYTQGGWNEPPPTNITVDEVRLDRDSLLIASDFTQLADSPYDTNQWAIYRQELRDLPDGYIPTPNPVFPTTPDLLVE